LRYSDPGDTLTLDILYQDRLICLVSKPPRLLVHRSRDRRDPVTVVDLLKERYPSPPSPVHRLDRPASGLLLCAFTPDAARSLGNAFTAGEVKKTYWAVVRGWPAETGSFSCPLKKPEGPAREARTDYRILQKIELPLPNSAYATSRYSLVEVRPLTGRYHQIRRHFAAAGYPLLGDSSHGDLRHNRMIRDYAGTGRLYLHAAALSFPHPETGKIMTVCAPLPDLDLWTRLGFTGQPGGILKSRVF